PPSVEIRNFPPASGNRLTYTSALPDSSDTYATHRPSGEITGIVSLNGVWRRISGARVLGWSVSTSSKGRVNRSHLVWEFHDWNASRLPSGENEDAPIWLLLCVSSTVAPAPSARIQFRLAAGDCFTDVNTMCLPSGDQTGAWS